MKNLALVLTILSLSFFACNKAEDVQDAVTNHQKLEQTNSTNQDENGQVSFRGPGTDCCCQMVISSTYFGGMTICGVDTQFANGACGVVNTSNCGDTGNRSQTLAKPGTFCVIPGSPFCITNTGNQQIQFYFTCNGNNISPTFLNPNQMLCYSWDCNGAIVEDCL